MDEHRDHIVVAGVDGSPESLGAVRWAAREADRRAVPLRLVAAIEWIVPRRIGATALEPAYIRDSMTEVAQERLDVAKAAAIGTVGGIDVRTEVLGGPAVAVLHEESTTAGLLVVGNRGVGGFAGLLAGSVSMAVAASAGCPVVVVRGDATADGPVVVGIDGSPVSEAAVSFAFAEASARRVPLVAVHVWTDAVLDPFAGPLVDWDAVEAEEAELLAQRLAGWSEKYPDVTVTRRVVRENPAAVLVGLSSTAQLLVVGGHGRGVVRGLLLGSVSQALLRHGACPVAVVKP